jgi:hypothetical protein
MVLSASIVEGLSAVTAVVDDYPQLCEHTEALHNLLREIQTYAAVKQFS